MNGGPSRKKRRAAFWLVSLALLACLVIAGYSPERPRVPFAAMPADSLVAAENLDLASNWRDRMSHPAVMAIMRAAGVEEPEEIADDADLELILELLCGKRTLLACAPPQGEGLDPVFFGASYVGPRLLPMRLMMLFRHVPGLGPLKRAKGGSLYLDFDNDPEAGEPVLSLDLHGGYLLAAWSEDPDAVRVLASRLDGDPAISPVFGGEEPWRDPLKSATRAWFDRGVIEDFAASEAEDGAGAFELGLLANPFLDVARWDSKSFEARLDLRVDTGGAMLPRLCGNCAALDTIPDAPPIALAVLPGDYASAAAEYLCGLEDGAAGGAAALEGDACLALVGREYGGSLLGLQIPGLQLTMPWDARAVPPARIVRQILEDSFGAGASLRPAAGSRTLVDPGKILPVPFADSDCVAVDARQGWATATYSAASADKLRSEPVTGEAAWRKGWRKAYASKSSFLYFWADLEALAEEASRVRSLYMLASALLKPADDSGAGEAIETAAALFADLAPAKRLEIAAEAVSVEGADEGMISLALRFGDPDGTEDAK